MLLSLWHLQTMSTVVWLRPQDEQSQANLRKRWDVDLHKLFKWLFFELIWRICSVCITRKSTLMCQKMQPYLYRHEPINLGMYRQSQTNLRWANFAWTFATVYIHLIIVGLWVYKYCYMCLFFISYVFVFKWCQLLLCVCVAGWPNIKLDL